MPELGWPSRSEWVGFVRARLLPLRKVAFVLKGRRFYKHRYYGDVLMRTLGRDAVESDISDHLGLIFFFAAQARPRLIVELGTRGGESTRSLLAAAEIANAIVLSVDTVAAGDLDLPCRERWRFVHADDIEFGRTGFADWCNAEGLEPRIDVLFVDTSHEYEHTREEIRVWEPWVAAGGLAMFHDSNMKALYARTNGRIGTGWNNKRGVIRAIEEFTGRRYDERSFFYDATDEYVVVHFPYCNGLTVLQKSPGSR